MTSKNEAPSAPLSSPDITSVDALAAQIRPAWETVETVETDTISAVAPHPIERVTAQPRTDQEATVKPVMVSGFEESGERKITDPRVHEDLTMRGSPPEEPEERTEVDRAVPIPDALAAPEPPARAAGSAGAHDTAHDTARAVDARALLHSDDQAEMALSPMRPRAITVPTGFPTGDVVIEERTQRQISAPRHTPARAIPFERDLPETEELVPPANKRRIRIVFGAMGGLVLLIGLGVIVKAAVGSSPASTPSAAALPVTHATSEPAHLEPAVAANLDAVAKPIAKVDIPAKAPRLPSDDDVAAVAPATPATPVAPPPTPPKPIVAARAPVTTPPRPPPPRPPTGARPPTTPPQPGKGGIVRDSPF